MPTDPLPRIDRRTAIKWMLAASTTMALGPGFAPGQMAAIPSGRGYGPDPDLLKHYQAGELWPLTLTDAQRLTAVVLSDFIMPADAQSPSASSVGVVDFIDEWISAPYPTQAADRAIVVPGLAWIEEEATKRFAKSFVKLDEAQKTAIGDDICFAPKAKPQFEAAARFFATYRNLTSGGYYSSPEGRKDLRYIGNFPMAQFDGPPPEVLRQAGLL